MTYRQEYDSWWAPSKKLKIFPAPELGSKAPSSPKLPHCGCPFAEKTFEELRKTAAKNPDVNFIAVSHSSEESTEKWVIAVGGQWDVKVIVDADRELYAQWGLGISNMWYVLNPWSLYSVIRLAMREKIINRPTESGTRWIAEAADDMPDFNEALKALGIEA
ncbi:hypothetical protein N431DRAFT_540883 [Stipitochalara longipes BDJ]|nr:hypothetical protein N431DRAFT_540883 [Stipitochalara longipes BDJ]